MRKQEYILTLVYAGLMIVVPFIGLPFGFSRAVVFLGSIVFLGYVWFRQHQKTHAPQDPQNQTTTVTQTITSETIIEQADDFAAEPTDPSEVSEQL